MTECITAKEITWKQIINLVMLNGSCLGILLINLAICPLQPAVFSGLFTLWEARAIFFLNIK
jgi:hypothetical protein